MLKGLRHSVVLEETSHKTCTIEIENVALADVFKELANQEPEETTVTIHQI